MRVLFFATLLALLTACGSAEDRAMAVCDKSLAEKATSPTYAIQKNTIKFTPNPSSPGEIVVSGQVIFDPGLPRASTQTFECTTRVAEGKSEPDVIGFSLIW